MSSQWAIDIIFRPLGALVLFGLAALLGKGILNLIPKGRVRSRLGAKVGNGTAALFLVSPFVLGMIIFAVWKLSQK